MARMDKNNYGFTFLEIIVVLAITVLFSTMTVGGYTAFNENKKVDADANQLVSTLELAKKKSRAGDKSGLTQGGTNYANCDLDAYKVTITSALAYELRASVCANASGLCPVGSGCTDVTIASYSLSPSMNMTPATGSVTFAGAGLAVSGVSSITVTNSRNNKSKVITISGSGSVEAN